MAEHPVVGLLRERAQARGQGVAEQTSPPTVPAKRGRPRGGQKARGTAAELEEAFRAKLYGVLVEPEVLAALRGLLAAGDARAWECVMKYGLLPRAESGGGPRTLNLVNLVERPEREKEAAAVVVTAPGRP